MSTVVVVLRVVQLLRLAGAMIGLVRVLWGLRAAKRNRLSRQELLELMLRNGAQSSHAAWRRSEVDWRREGF